MASEIPTPAAPVPAASPVVSPDPTHPVTLAIDVGGSALKAMLLDAAGKPVS